MNKLKVIGDMVKKAVRTSSGHTARGIFGHSKTADFNYTDEAEIYGKNLAQNPEFNI
jgi:hypothetical protein